MAVMAARVTRDVREPQPQDETTITNHSTIR